MSKSSNNGVKVLHLVHRRLINKVGIQQVEHI